MLLTTDTVGGVWTYSLELARGLRAHDIDVVLATMGAPLTAGQRAEADEVGLAGLHESDYALEWMPEPWREVDAAGDWLRQLARAESVGVVQLASYAHAALAWGRPVVVVAHSCVGSWWRAVEGTEAPREWDAYRARVRAGLRAADAVVAPTRWMLQALARDYAFASGTVIANGSSAAESADPTGEFVLSAGRLWDRAKGLDTLDHAAAGLSWPVVAVGEGGAATNLRMMGPLPSAELARLRARAPVFAAPARYEPFGLGILEAARAGCALVLGDIPSLRELWARAAVFVDPHDPDALRLALQRLIDAPAERRRLARAAHLRARRFSVARMARLYVGLYARVARRVPALDARADQVRVASGG